MPAETSAGRERDLHGEAGVVRFRTPTPSDGPAITALIRSSPPLDVNSAYCNLVQCAHFAPTCVVAERGGRLVGWISGHRPPTTPEEIFVWQVAVAEEARGEGLAGRMLDALLSRAAVRDAEALSTTITADNAASWALFEGFARKRGLGLSKSRHFTRETHFAGRHDTEWLVTISLLTNSQEQHAKEDI
jgi:L-2,4-diaminobutyric acid acetyltransferase